MAGKAKRSAFKAKAKKPRAKKPRTSTGQRSNAWRAYVGGGTGPVSNEPIAW
jgi:hypothetical protein